MSTSSVTNSRPHSLRRIVIAITGATGACYGVRCLELLRTQPDVEAHLIISPAGLLNIQHELGLERDDVWALADTVHSFKDIGSTLASGSFPVDAMVVAPCSMRSLASIAHGLADNLITRAADVALKERRKLVLVVRETPFNLAHLRNMTAATEMGAVIFPPLPAFYFHPQNVQELIDHSVLRILAHAGVELPAPEWQGLAAARHNSQVLRATKKSN